MILTIDEIKNRINPICKRYGIKRAYLFGSYARGEATEDSDVDIRIEKGKIRGFQIGGFYIDIKNSLNKELDLLSTIPEHPNFKNALYRDEVIIYETN